ncbi:MAG TPA: hypothetical protein VMH80_12355 [Bryobacteraceae bacterium]|nr:hypothetical protein [Bryobacteraceae bacterium]
MAQTALVNESKQSLVGNLVGVHYRGILSGSARQLFRLARHPLASATVTFVGLTGDNLSQLHSFCILSFVTVIVSSVSLTGDVNAHTTRPMNIKR